MDGTLFDSIVDIADANNAMLRSCGYPEHSVGKYIGWVGNGAMRLVKASLPETAGFDEQSLANYLAVFGKIYAENLVVKSKLFSGIESVLDYLTDVKLPFALNTNKPQLHTGLIVKQCFARWNFRQVVAQENGWPKKPDPSGALDIARKMGIAPDNVLYIGDSAVDLNTAINAGMQFLGVSWGYGRISSLPESRKLNIVDEAKDIILFIKKNSA
ncbi:MAG: HAD hydrolase-like protein [Bacteroidales bacterium]|nr:HAD hydrolase-like protein [Bacteroidales bacterium]